MLDYSYTLFKVKAQMHQIVSLILLITHKLSPFDFAEKKVHQSSPAILRA
jgi:hypothetical protein